MPFLILLAFRLLWAYRAIHFLRAYKQYAPTILSLTIIFRRGRIYPIRIIICHSRKRESILDRRDACPTRITGSINRTPTFCLLIMFSAFFIPRAIRYTQYAIRIRLMNSIFFTIYYIRHTIY